MSANICILFIVICCPFIDGVRDLPPYFPKCSRDDPHLNTCLVKASNAVKPFLVKGVSELGILPISPYVFPEVTLEQGTSAVQFKSSLRNVTVLGLETYNVTQFDYDVENKKFLCQLTMSPLQLQGEYSISGKILAIPIQGHGMFTTNISYCNGTLHQDVKLVTRGRYVYLEIVNSSLSIDAEGISAQLEGLFGDNKALGAATNRAINDNVNEIFGEVKPVVQKVILKMIEDLQSKITRKVPYDLLYPRKT